MEKILSICIPIYNGGELAYNHIKEILTYPKKDIEVVVSDNASTDNTLELLQQIDDERLRIVKQSKNVGPFHNWYYALMAGEAKYVMLFQDNDILITKNLEQYITFLKSVDYPIMRNTNGAFQNKTKEISIPQVQYYNVLYGHAGNVVYLSEALHSIKPMKFSFGYDYISYPYVVWDTQILKKYPICARKAFLYGDVILRYTPRTYIENKSRTQKYTSAESPAYSYKNTECKFVKYMSYLRYMYPKDCEYFKILCNSYRVNLYLATSHFYVIMKAPEQKWMKLRYGLDALDEENIDYVSLNSQFFDSIEKRIKMKSFFWRMYTIVWLKVITAYNKNNFILNYETKGKGFVSDLLRKIIDVVLAKIIEKVCE